MTAGLPVRTPSSAARFGKVRFLAGERHHWLDALCSKLERVAWGQAAAQLLTQELPVAGSLTVLPLWVWSAPIIDVGRKSRGVGGQVLLPVLAQHEGGPLVLRTAEASGATSTAGPSSTDRSWRATGLGVDIAGTIRISTVHVGTVHVGAGQPGQPGQPAHLPIVLSPVDGQHLEIGEPISTGRQLRSALRKLERDGLSARWEIIGDLKPYVEAAVRDAHGYVCKELAGDTAIASPVLDRIGLERVSDALIVGRSHDEIRPSGSKDPVLYRLVDRLITDGGVTGADPQMFIRRALRRDAEQEIRISIDDPRIGPKVRAVHRQVNAQSLEELVAAYRERYPYDDLSVRRAAKALTTPALVKQARDTRPRNSDVAP
ncbi:MAG: hypothetical protein WKF57_06505 [Nakamurella sp.]